MPPRDARSSASLYEEPTPPVPPDARPARIVERPGGFRGRVVERLEEGGSYPHWVLWAALAGMFATTFPVTILTVSLGAIAREFGARETTMAWVISAPMLLSAAALPLLGKLGDLYGHRRVFLSGFAAATVAAVLSATAWSPLSLIGFRTLAAVVGGATQPTAMALIFGVYSASRRVRAMGWWSMTAAAAPAVGLIAGGPLVDWLGWRIVFVLQAVFSLLALALAALILRETARQRVRFDVAGSLTVACGVGGFMFALGQVRELGLGSPWVWGAALLGCLGIRGFVGAERRAAAPLLPLEFFRRRNFSAPMLATALMGAAYMGAFVIAPLVLLRVFDFSISAAAGIMLLRTLSLTFSSPLGGAVGMRFGERTAAVLGSGVLTVGLVLVAAGALRESLWILGAGLVLQGMGHGLGLPSLTSSVSNAVPEESLGIASAASRLCNQAGAAMGITLLSLVYGGVNTGRAFALAFCVGAGLSLFSLVTSLFMQREERALSGP